MREKSDGFKGESFLSPVFLEMFPRYQFTKALFRNGEGFFCVNWYCAVGTQGGSVRRLYREGSQDLKGALFIKATDVALIGRVADRSRILAEAPNPAPATNSRKSRQRNLATFFIFIRACFLIIQWVPSD